MATWASDGSVADVQDIHDNDASDGDTITIPSGTFVWSSTLTISKGITLQGLTTTNVVAKTADDESIIGVGTGTSGNQALINVNTTLGKTYRITGLSFITDRVGAVNSNGMIRLTGTSEAMRLDNCHFNDCRYENERIACYGPLGVIDHNLFYQPTNAGFPLHFHNKNWNSGSGSWGDQSWAEEAYYGTENFMFVEDNCFNNTGSVFRGYCDAVDGARFVIRYNHCYNMAMGNHGTEVGRLRGVRAFEVYSNDHHFTFANPLAGTRSGSCLIYDNTWDGTAPTSGFSINTYRMFINSNSVFGGSTGESDWDYNVTESDGSHVDGNPSFLFDSGTATGGSQTTLVDSGKAWDTNEWAGYTVTQVNGTNPGIMLITSNTATTLTGIYHAGYNGGVEWAASDDYEIRKVLISMDQPGRGMGDLVVLSPPENDTTGVPSWVHQELEPCYAWNNEYTPTSTAIELVAESNLGANFYLIEDRDFYNSAMPGYTAYTYPHPLVSGEEPAATALHGANVLLAVRL